MPTSANDANYDNPYRGSVPGWLAYDLSTVPSAQRGAVIVAWYNTATYPYDHAAIGEVGYDIPGSYVLEANAAAGGVAPPSGNWVTLANVTGNTKHSRQHAVDLTGYNWLRFRVTVSDGSTGNFDAAYKLDVHDASRGANDDWIFYGDSITANTMGEIGAFAQLVAAAKPGYFPAAEAGGTGGWTSADGAAHVGTWLTLFPGRYVGLSFGTNDAGAGCDTADLAAFRSQYVTMISAVLAAGKVPVIPTIPWAQNAGVQQCGPQVNAQIQALYQAYPQVVHGPDLWTFFQANQGLISSDGLHPSGAGNISYRQQWATAMLNEVYP